jgi:beta-ribofuranosylaminobenzene 5'-phosphate synthase
MEKIKTGSRLHLGLIDMNGELGRVDGGIGIALENPGFEMGFEKRDEIRISYLGKSVPSHIRSAPQGCRDPAASLQVRVLQEEAQKMAEKVCPELNVGGIGIDIGKAIPEHVGFGSRTQLYLAIAAGICRVYGIEKNTEELGRIVGRGGTSGIGVAAFEKGGIIVDGGHPSEKGFSPSRFSEEGPAPVLARYDFPWWMVCAWPEREGVHGEREKSIFEEQCPIPAEEVGQVSRIILMKMLPALVEGDISGFGDGVNMLQETGFKKREISLQGDDVRGLLAFLKENSSGAGMSSFGPVCFGLCESEKEALELEKKVRGKFDFKTVTTKASKGAKWL